MSNSWSQASGVFQLYSDALAGLGQHLTEPVWQSLMAELRGCQGKVVVTGVGTSGIAARKVAHMLACVERPAIYLNATDAAHGDLGFLRADDLVIMLSRGGNSDAVSYTHLDVYKRQRSGCSMGYRSTGWHYQLRKTSAALRGIYRSTH